MADLKQVKAAATDTRFQGAMAKIVGFFKPDPANKPSDPSVEPAAPRPKKRVAEQSSPAATQQTTQPAWRSAPAPQMQITPPPDPRSYGYRRVSGGPGQPPRYVPRNTGGEGDGSSRKPPITIPAQAERKESAMTAQTATADDSGSNKNGLFAALIIAVLAGFALTIAYASFAYRQKMQNDFDNTAAGRAIIANDTLAMQRKLVLAEAEKIAAERGGTAVPQAVVVQQAPPAQAVVTQTSGDVQKLSLVPCGTSATRIMIGSGDMRLAEGGPQGGCLAIQTTGPVHVNGTYYELRAASNFDKDYVADIGLGDNAATVWLNNHVGQDVVVVIKTHNSNYGWIKFN